MTEPATSNPVDSHVLVVVVNYRTPDLTVDCLASLAGERARQPGLRVAVADAASGDDSMVRIRAAIEERRWGGWIRLEALPCNGGFSYANNAILRTALASPKPPAFVLLLNPDTAVLPGAVDELVSFLEQHPAAGIAGSRLEDPDGAPQVSAFRFPGVVGEFEGAIRLGPVSRLLARWAVAPSARDESHRTDWVAGASMLVRREVFEQVGLLDEGYFLYFEEVDFCLAAGRAGWQCWYVPASRVVHLVGQATRVSDGRLRAPRRPEYWFASRRRYYLKNFGPLTALAADLALLSGYAIRRVRRRLERGPDLDPPHFLGDLVRYSVLARGFQL